MVSKYRIAVKIPRRWNRGFTICNLKFTVSGSRPVSSAIVETTYAEWGDVAAWNEREGNPLGHMEWLLGYPPPQNVIM